MGVYCAAHFHWVSFILLYEKLSDFLQVIGNRCASAAKNQSLPLREKESTKWMLLRTYQNKASILLLHLPCPDQACGLPESFLANTTQEAWCTLDRLPVRHRADTERRRQILVQSQRQACRQAVGKKLDCPENIHAASTWRTCKFHRSQAAREFSHDNMRRLLS